MNVDRGFTLRHLTGGGIVVLAVTLLIRSALNTKATALPSLATSSSSTPEVLAWTFALAAISYVLGVLLEPLGYRMARGIRRRVYSNVSSDIPSTLAHELDSIMDDETLPDLYADWERHLMLVLYQLVSHDANQATQLAARYSQPTDFFRTAASSTAVAFGILVASAFIDVKDSAAIFFCSDGVAGQCEAVHGVLLWGEAFVPAIGALLVCVALAVGYTKLLRMELQSGLTRLIVSKHVGRR